MAVRARVADDYGSRFSSFVSARAHPFPLPWENSFPHPSSTPWRKGPNGSARGLEAGIEEKSEEKWEGRKREPIQLADDFNARRANVGGPQQLLIIPRNSYPSAFALYPFHTNLIQVSSLWKSKDIENHFSTETFRVDYPFQILFATHVLYVFFFFFS